MAKSYKTICGILLAIVVFCVIILVSFYVKTYTVTYDTKGGTIYASQEVKRNSKAIMPADPVMEGYTFVGWYVNDVEYDFNTEVTENITIVAKWKKLEDLPQE